MTESKTTIVALLFTASLLLLRSNASGQEHLRAGYIVAVPGDTIQGLVANQSTKKSRTWKGLNDTSTLINQVLPVDQLFMRPFNGNPLQLS